MLYNDLKQGLIFYTKTAATYFRWMFREYLPPLSNRLHNLI